MQYGYFDLKNKEYVIDHPDTPAPWVNYLGSPEYGAMISNNAAGYSFVKSGANGRISRFRFNSMMALPGRYIYLRDNDTKDYWSATWQPVGKPLDAYKSVCRHRTAYTVISADYAGIQRLAYRLRSHIMVPSALPMRYGVLSSPTTATSRETCLHSVS